MIETITPIALGVLGWFVAKFLAEPFRKFFDLKGEVARQLVLFGNVRAENSQASSLLPGKVSTLSPDERARLTLAQTKFRDLAAQVSGFEQSETIASRVLNLLGYDLRATSAALIGVSNTIGEYGHERAHFFAETKARLKLSIA